MVPRPVRTIAVVLLLSLFAVASLGFSAVEFRQTSLPDFESSGGWRGAVLFDYNNDNRTDILVLSGFNEKKGLFENQGGLQFVDKTHQAGLQAVLQPVYLSGGLAADLDNDGWQDLIVFGSGQLFLFRNNKDGTFSRINEASTYFEKSKSPQAACAADVNKDSLLDIFVANSGDPALMPNGSNHLNRFYLNQGNMVFSDVTEFAGISKDGAMGALSCVFFDYDNDGDSDLLVVNGNRANLEPAALQLYHNDFKKKDAIGSVPMAKFKLITEKTGLGSHRGFPHSAALADFDVDGDVDIFITALGMLNKHRTPIANVADMPHLLFMNGGDGSFHDGAHEMGVGYYDFAVGAVAADFNNDGRPDLFFTGASPSMPFIDPSPGRLLFNTITPGWMRSIHFKESSEYLNFDFSDKLTSAALTADFDNDGFPDLFVVTSKNAAMPNRTYTGTGAPVLLRNQGNKSGWLGVRLVGVNCSRDAVGAKVTLFKGVDDVPLKELVGFQEVRLGSGFSSSQDPRLLFGLGSLETVSAKIHWPSGLIEYHLNLPRNAYYTFVEGAGVPRKQVKEYSYEFFDVQKTWVHEVKGWVCGTCRSLNHHAHTSCGGCGAPKPVSRNVDIDISLDSGGGFGEIPNESGLSMEEIQARMNAMYSGEMPPGGPNGQNPFPPQFANEDDVDDDMDSDGSGRSVPEIDPSTFGFGADGKPTDPNWKMENGQFVYKWGGDIGGVSDDDEGFEDGEDVDPPMFGRPPKHDEL